MTYKATVALIVYVVLFLHRELVKNLFYLLPCYPRPALGCSQGDRISQPMLLCTKMKFPLRISSVNLTKFSCGFGHI